MQLPLALGWPDGTPYHGPPRAVQARRHVPRSRCSTAGRGRGRGRGLLGPLDRAAPAVHVAAVAAAQQGPDWGMDIKTRKRISRRRRAAMMMATALWRPRVVRPWWWRWVGSGRGVPEVLGAVGVMWLLW